MILRQQDIGAGLSIIKRVMMMMQLNIQCIADRIELVIRQLRPELATGL